MLEKNTVDETHKQEVHSTRIGNSDKRGLCQQSVVWRTHVVSKQPQAIPKVGERCKDEVMNEAEDESIAAVFLKQVPHGQFEVGPPQGKLWSEKFNFSLGLTLIFLCIIGLRRPLVIFDATFCHSA